MLEFSDISITYHFKNKGERRKGNYSFNSQGPKSQEWQNPIPKNVKAEVVNLRKHARKIYRNAVNELNIARFSPQ